MGREPARAADEAARPGLHDWAEAALGALAPPAFALMAFASGAVLLATSAFPELQPRMAALETVAPLLVIELSHFLGSVVGLLLLLVAAGLWRKREGAYVAALVLLALGALFALMRGLDYVEASLLAAVALGLFLSRDAFTRQSRLLREPLTWPWFAGVAATVAGAGALGFFGYREIAYSDELWWTFLLDADVSRFFRAGVGVVLIAAIFAGVQLIAPPRSFLRGRPDAAALTRARAALESAEHRRPDAWLALCADKDLLFSQSGASFLALRARGRHWIALGGPSGKRADFAELYWTFAERADAAGALPVFYGLCPEELGAVAELGFIARKVGETALVRTASFSLEGKARQPLRTARNKCVREGCAFAVSDFAACDEAQLRAVSDAWLHAHGGREKGFSMGRFDRDYLAATPIAHVTQNGRIIAFANVMLSSDKREASVDLMRHDASAAPAGVMDYLFVELIAWARAEGYGALDLGMTPLAGLASRRLAPAMTRIGAAVYARGERVYGFRGLRAYKEKFEPEWRGVYLAAPPQASAPLALLDAALLTSGGWAGALGLR